MALIRQPLEAKPLKQIIQFGLDLLYPPRCAGCGAAGTVLCDDCLSQFQPVDQPFSISVQDVPDSETQCRIRSMVILSDVWYQPPASSVVLCLKYRPDRRLAAILANRLADLSSGAGITADLAVVIPLGKKRLRHRGYNQVEIIARPFCDRLGIRYAAGALKRTRETATQVGLDPEERKRNVSGAFAAERSMVHGRRIILLDDVVTTGATLLSAAGVLFRAGARNVTGLTVARALSQSNWQRRKNECTCGVERT